MRNASRWLWLGLIPAAVAAGFFAGCSGSSSSTSGGGSSTADTSTSSPSKADKVALKADGRGNLVGHIKIDGDVPDREKLNAARKKQEEDVSGGGCVTASTKPEEMIDESWVINKDGGIKNVVVWLMPPDTGHFFQLDEDDLKPNGKTGWAEEVELTQPHCAFIKRVSVLFPSYLDAEGKSKDTTQKYKVTNTSTITHNTLISALNNYNQTIPPGKEESIPRPRPKGAPYAVECKVHTWMNAFFWAFDHPFAAVTDEKGNFTIKNAPAGAELKVMVWQEKAAFVNGEKGKAFTLKKDQDNQYDVSIPYKD
jgi:hypothetical protein